MLSLPLSFAFAVGGVGRALGLGFRLLHLRGVVEVDQVLGLFLLLCHVQHLCGVAEVDQVPGLVLLLCPLGLGFRVQRCGVVAL